MERTERKNRPEELERLPNKARKYLTMALKLTDNATLERLARRELAEVSPSDSAS